ncbi:unnamed protein product [Rhizophagus irregularis]|nr:unnamed protein product [Rhizophagus irregularis]
MIHIDRNYLHAIIGISLRFSHFSLILSILSIFTLNKKLREYLDIKNIVDIIINHDLILSIMNMVLL